MNTKDIIGAQFKLGFAAGLCEQIVEKMGEPGEDRDQYIIVLAKRVQETLREVNENLREMERK